MKHIWTKINISILYINHHLTSKSAKSGSYPDWVGSFLTQPAKSILIRPDPTWPNLTISWFSCHFNLSFFFSNFVYISLRFGGFVNKPMLPLQFNTFHMAKNNILISTIIFVEWNNYIYNFKVWKKKFHI